MKHFALILLLSVPTYGQTVAAVTVDPKARAVSDAEKPTKSAEGIQRMRVVLREVLGKLEEARKSKDVIRLNCVNEKLTQVKGLLRISEQADRGMQEALARKETSTAENEFLKIGLARSKVDQLRSEAEQCVGELAFRADQNLLVEVEVPSDLPMLDPTRPDDSDNVSVRVPPTQPIGADVVPLPEAPSPTL